jgi:hypothetical protein
LNTQDDAERSLIPNYLKLARAVVAKACLDYIATRHPVSARAYLASWRALELHNANSKRRRQMARRMSLEVWARLEQRHLRAAFADGLGALAEDVQMTSAVQRAVSGEHDRKRVREIMGTKRPNYTRGCAFEENWEWTESRELAIARNGIVEQNLSDAG